MMVLPVLVLAFFEVFGVFAALRAWVATPFRVLKENGFSEVLNLWLGVGNGTTDHYRDKPERRGG